MTDLVAAAPKQAPSGTSLRRTFAADGDRPPPVRMLVALAAIWIGFGIWTGGKILQPASMVTLAVQTTVVAIMATGMVLVIVVAQHRPVGRLDRRRHRNVYALLMTDWLPNMLGIS